VNEEMKEVSFFALLLRYVGPFFTSTVLAISIVGMVFFRFEPGLQETSSLFALAPLGLTYNAILQIFGSSVILTGVFIFLFSEQFFYKMRFLLRLIIFLLMTLLIFALSAIIFKWFPVNEPMNWLRFFISAFICFFLSIGLALVKRKLEGKKYNMLLENYKVRHNIK